jgi:protein-L-isoaspartate(D-aspartate) O-methyltransferase
MICSVSELAPEADSYAKARFNMVESQIRTNRVTDSALLAAMADIPRQNFVPSALAGVAYVDKSLQVAPGRYLTEPLFLARLLQEANVETADRILVVGCGTGYSAAVSSRLATFVIALESDADLADKARANLAGLGLTNVSVVTGPLTAGWAASAPYNVILIDGVVADLPDAILDQLSERGRLVTIRSQEGRAGSGMLYRKLSGAVSGRALFDAAGPFLQGFSPVPAFAF